jgi:pyruvate/2-oxoglutarate dehydrogenase complex dihydrolipoamide acyltransferase (E2) component
MSTITLSTTASKALTAYATAGTAFRNKTKLAVDALVADGIKPEDMEAPGKEGDRTFYDSLLAVIQAGMSADARALINADPKALTEEKKVERRYQMTQRSSLLKDLRNALKRRLASNEKGARHTMSVAERIMKRVEEIKDIVSKAEDPTFEVTKVLAGLAQLEKLLK